MGVHRLPLVDPGAELRMPQQAVERFLRELEQGHVGGGFDARGPPASHEYGYLPEDVARSQVAQITAGRLRREYREPPRQTLRYRVLHAAARPARSGRQQRPKISATWPWAADIVTAWERISTLPHAP
jgi:hypothetical protein